MEIATGTPEAHPGSGANPQPYDPSMSPGVAPPTATDGLLTPADQTPVPDAGAAYQARLSAYESDMRAAQARGQDIRNAMLAHYSADILPQGAAYGDDLPLPPVPPNAVPSEASDLHPWSGDEPVPSGVGFYHPPGSMPQ